MSADFYKAFRKPTETDSYRASGCVVTSMQQPELLSQAFVCHVVGSFCEYVTVCESPRTDKKGEFIF